MLSPMKTSFKRRKAERSFTLVETAIAIGMLAFAFTMMLTVNGNAITFTDYEKNSSKAVWLAKRVMAQVEYYWNKREFDDLKTKQEGVPFAGDDLEGFEYKLEIDEWKLPLVDLIAGGGIGGGEDTESGGGEEEGGGDFIKAAIDQALDGEPLLKTAYVEVSWPEGAVRNSVSLTYLLTNQQKFNEKIALFKSVYDKLTKPPRKKGKGSGKGKKGTPPKKPGGQGGGN